MAVSSHPDRYHQFGTTAGGDQRYRCKACRRTFSIGKPTRRQKQSAKNSQVLRLLVNGMPISKISEITGLNPRDVYRKIDFIYERVRAFVCEREGLLAEADWERAGRRFTTDSQTLTINWPNKRTRAAVAVQHLCTAHANSGFIVAAHLQFDPVPDMQVVEAEMVANDDFQLDRCFRKQGRLWSQREFRDYLDKITREIPVGPEEAPEVAPGLQLPHSGALVRQDIQQFAHALTIKRLLGKSDLRFVFVLDRDPGLAAAFLAAFVPEVKARRVDVLVIAFDKHQINDARNRLVAEGRKALAADTGMKLPELDTMERKPFEQLVDAAIEQRLTAYRPKELFAWPYHTKSEPARMIQLLTDRQDFDPARRARLMRLATLRSVDAYFHKVRSNIRATARAAATPSGNGQTWDRYYLYKPEMLEKVIEIYRFTHNWMGSRQTKKTPAMKLGLAKGRIYERDLFG